MTEQLLAALARRVNHRGRVIANQTSLLDELRVPPEVLSAELRKLENARLIEVLSPLPFLVLTLHSWSGTSPDPAPKGQQISSSVPAVYKEVPVSSAAAAATQQREVGGAGEGETLLGEVLRVLGPEADREEFRAILTGHDPALIHRCLGRVQATKSIRVSRAALFRSLLSRLGR